MQFSLRLILIRIGQALIVVLALAMTLRSLCAGLNILSGISDLQSLDFYVPGMIFFPSCGPVMAIAGLCGGIRVYSAMPRTTRNDWYAIFMGGLTLLLSYVALYAMWMALLAFMFIPFGEFVLLIFASLLGVWVIPNIILKASRDLQGVPEQPADSRMENPLHVSIPLLVCLLLAVLINLVTAAVMAGEIIDSDVIPIAVMCTVFIVSLLRYGWLSGLFWGLLGALGGIAYSNLLYDLYIESNFQILGGVSEPVIWGTGYLIVTSTVLLGSRKIVLSRRADVISH